MRMLKPSFLLILAGLVVIATGQAMAQSSSYGISKPFSNYRPRPTVSPYMNLFRDSTTLAGDFDYQTLVRPQLEQQRVNLRQQRTNLLQRQTNLQQQRSGQRQQQSIQMLDQQTSSPIPQTVLRPTGVGLRRPVGSRFMNMYQYYPPTRLPRRR